MKLRLITSLALILLAVFTGLVFTHNVSALSGKDFRAGRIIDDSTFYQRSAMSVAEIQNFLNAKLPTCDTAGQKSYTYHYRSSDGRVNNSNDPVITTTRATYGSRVDAWQVKIGEPSKGSKAPYTCLKDYKQNTPYKAGESGLCSAINAQSNRSSANIINDVAQACGVSQKVIIVLLNKEQSLVTDDWPWGIQYRSATGYGCPDTADCDSDYYGFFNQVYHAALQYKRYQADPENWNHIPRMTNQIWYQANAPSCGKKSVYIENQATAGLYNYTPYTPNKAALDNLYGTGDSCSAYGNRNFWRQFFDWFGPPINLNCVYPMDDSGGVYRLYNPTTKSYFMTTSQGEVCTATGKMGYQYDSPVFYPLNTGNDPVFRLVKNGKYLFTASISERDKAVSNYGFKFEGVAFNASTSAEPTTSPLAVYRLSHPSGGYAYTISEVEAAEMVSKMGYSNEGVVFYTNNTTGKTYPHAVYRLAHPSSGYLYTTSESERDTAVSNYRFRDEGIAFNTRIGYTKDNLPVYRLASNKGYLLTTSLNERTRALSLGYRSEGVAYFAYPISNLGATRQVYRLAHSNGAYLYTTSESERDTAVSNYGFRYEGVGFRLP